MSDNVMIRVEGLSKRYELGRSATAQRYTALRDILANAVKRPLRRLRQSAAPTRPDRDEAFWALRDVNMAVRRGEVVGIIGRNGAGKSTLLKLLSRITEPTTGRIRLRGRVASLLEVGTGFHPELTGRENIFLNGAILGMGRAEIGAKFDEIVAFAEVERFLDTPVKRYSSGMYVRLAFAVAAHLSPEILIVDEVLAVGDADFQKKCLGKMGEVSANEGRTVIFVSHNMAVVNKLCARGILLEKGGLAFDGPASEAIRRYLKVGGEQSSVINLEHSVSRDAAVRIQSGKLLRSGVDSHEFVLGDALTVKLEVEVRQACRFGVELLLRDKDGAPIVFLPAGFVEHGQSRCEPGWIEALCTIPVLNLAQGMYSLDVLLSEGGIRVYQNVESAFTFQVNDAQIFNNGWEFRQSGGQSAVLWPPVATFRPIEGHSL